MITGNQAKAKQHCYRLTLVSLVGKGDLQEIVPDTLEGAADSRDHNRHLDKDKIRLEVEHPAEGKQNLVRFHLCG